MGRAVAAADSRVAPVRHGWRPGPLWARSAAAWLGGAGVMSSLMINLSWLPGLDFAPAMLLVMLCAFPVWIALAYYCYHARSLAAAWRGLALLALPSLLVNLALYAY